MNTPLTLPLKLKQLRTQEHYTQAYVARQLGITRQAYGHYEQGLTKPDLQTLTTLAQLYQMPISLFIDYNDPDYRTCSVVAEDSLYDTAHQSLSLSPDFLDYFNEPKNQKDYHSLNRIEKELLFYFRKLPRAEQGDFLLFIYLKSIKENPIDYRPFPDRDRDE